MQIKSVFVKELSQRVKIVQAERQELIEDLGSLSTSISKMTYKSWVLENYILGINQVFSQLMELGQGDLPFTNRVKESLFKAVVQVNPALNPDGLYVSGANTVTLKKTTVKLKELEGWSVKEDASNLIALDFDDFYELMDNARNFDHYLAVEPWKLLPHITVKLRQFSKSVKSGLMEGYVPKSEDDIKSFVVASCVENFSSLLKYLASENLTEVVSFDKIISSLYDQSIKHNPFLKLKVKDFQQLNKGYRFYRAGQSDQEPSDQVRLKKSLKEVSKAKVQALESTILTKIFGQDEAVKAVCRAVQKAYSGLKNPKTPIASFFFFGPTSTGKTELAKVLAKELTGSASGLLKVPCNTMTASHNVHTLIGAPPGYVGYEEKGLLAKGLERTGFKVILFDEFEKAHPKLADIVLELMEEGEITVADGSVVKVSECLIIFTSNIGQSEAENALNSAGFKVDSFGEEHSKIIEETFNKTFNELTKPEFRSRLSGVFYFPRLSQESLVRSARVKLLEYEKILQKKHVNLKYHKDLAETIVSQVCERSPKPHARDVRNYIDLDVMDKLGDFILGAKLKAKGEYSVEILIKDGIISFNLEDTTSGTEIDKKDTRQSVS